MRIDRIKLVTALATADMSIKQLSTLTGISRNTITAIKSGKSCSEKTAKKLISVLGEDLLEKSDLKGE